LKVIDDVLCAFLAGGYIPFEDFVRLQYLTILEKEDFKPFKKVINEKEKKIGSLL